MFLEVAAVEQADLGEQHRRHKRHLSELLQTALHPKLVALFLRHEGHDAANIGPAYRPGLAHAGPLRTRTTCYR